MFNSANFHIVVELIIVNLGLLLFSLKITHTKELVDHSFSLLSNPYMQGGGMAAVRMKKKNSVNL